MTYTLAHYHRDLVRITRPGWLVRALAALPVLRGLVGDLDAGRNDTRRILGILTALTPAECADRALLDDSSRQQRIAAGAGVSRGEVRRLLTEFDESASFINSTEGKGVFERLRMARQLQDEAARFKFRTGRPD